MNSHTLQKIRRIKWNEAVLSHSHNVRGGLKGRRYELWKKLKAGLLRPEIAIKVSHDYAKEFAEFEKQSTPA